MHGPCASVSSPERGRSPQMPSTVYRIPHTAYRALHGVCDRLRVRLPVRRDCPPHEAEHRSFGHGPSSTTWVSSCSALTRKYCWLWAKLQVADLASCVPPRATVLIKGYGVFEVPFTRPTAGGEAALSRRPAMRRTPGVGPGPVILRPPSPAHA